MGLESDNLSQPAQEGRTGYGDQLGKDMVTIFIGEQKVEQPVHKKLLCTWSPYFDTMFNGPFEEGTTQIANDVEATPEAFDLFLNWLYTGQKPHFSTVGELTGCDHDAECEEHMIAFYVLADKYMLQDDLKEHLVQTVAERNRPGTIFNIGGVKDVPSRAVYDSIKDLPEGDPMRKGVITRACKASLPLSNKTTKADKKKWLEECTEHMGPGLLRQFMRTYYDTSALEIEELDAKHKMAEAKLPDAKRQKPVNSDTSHFTGATPFGIAKPCKPRCYPSPFAFPGAHDPNCPNRPNRPA